MDGPRAAHEAQSMCICRYELSKVIEELKALKADIIGLQEVDIGCERSNNVDTGKHACMPTLYHWQAVTLHISGPLHNQATRKAGTSWQDLRISRTCLAPCPNRAACRGSDCGSAWHELHLPL